MKRSQSFPRVTLKHGKYWGVHSIYCALSFRVRFKQLPGTCTEMGKHCWVLGVPIVTGFQRLPSLCLLNLCTATILGKFSAHERGEAPPSPKCLLSLGILRIKRRTYDRREGRETTWSSFLLSLYLFLPVYVYVHMCAGTHRGPGVVLESQELEPQVVEGHPTSMLGTKLQFSARVASLLTHWAIFPAPLLLFISVSSALVTLFPSFLICNIAQLK